METKGWKSFWTALWVSLLVLLPLVAGTAVLAQRQAAGRVRASESQSGVPVQLPRAENHLTLLACVAGEDPAFVLLYLNADQNCIHLLGVPGQLAVPFSDGEASLADCYAAAGPARCLQGLGAVFDLPEDARVEIDVRGRRLPGALPKRHLRSNTPPYAIPELCE